MCFKVRKESVHCQEGGTDVELSPLVSGVVVLVVPDGDKGGPGSEKDDDMPASEKGRR
jgi:hypothetical protein